jgi:hypothetical protein
MFFLPVFTDGDKNSINSLDEFLTYLPIMALFLFYSFIGTCLGAIIGTVLTFPCFLLGTFIWRGYEKTPLRTKAVPLVLAGLVVGYLYGMFMENHFQLSAWDVPRQVPDIPLAFALCGTVATSIAYYFLTEDVPAPKTKKDGAPF